LDIVQICKDDQEQAFAMLAAVLWLGNISFQVIDNGNHVEVLANEGKIDIILSKLNCQLSVLANSR
jgi:myosin-5